VIAPQAERLLIRRGRGVAKVEANQDVGVENNRDATLRGGTWTIPVHTVTPQQSHGLFFSTATEARRSFQLSVELLIVQTSRRSFHELLSRRTGSRRLIAQPLQSAPTMPTL